MARRSPLPTTVLDKVKAFLTKTGARRARPFTRKLVIPDGVRATSATVREMARLAGKGAHDILVRLWAVDIIDEMSQRTGVPIQGRDHEAVAQAIYYWLQDNGAGDRSGLKFFNDNVGAEMVQAPFFSMGISGSGDCDCFVTALAALLLSVGVNCFIRTVKVDPRRPDLYSHVYVVARIRGKGNLPLDASVGFSRPGSEPRATYGVRDWEIPFEVSDDHG